MGHVRYLQAHQRLSQGLYIRHMAKLLCIYLHQAAVVQDVAHHATIVALNWASLALPCRRRSLGVSLGHGSNCGMLAEGQLSSAASLCSWLMRAGLTTIVADGFLDANSEGFQFKVSGEDVGQSKSLLANIGPESVE